MIGRRIISGILVGVAWLLGLCYLPGWCLFFVLLVMAGVCQNEFYQMMNQRGLSLNRAFGLGMGVVWITICYAYPPYVTSGLPLGHQLETLVIASMIFVLLLYVLFDARVQRPVEQVGVTLLGFFYVPFMLSFFIRLAQWGAHDMFQFSSTRVGVFLAAYLAFVVKLSDVGAFTFGMLLGKHKMFPRISPKKTWEGLAGGILVAIGASVLMLKLSQSYDWLSGSPLQGLSVAHAVTLGGILAMVGVLGDLIESLFKRSAQIKDSAELLPGMGGILDMFDSLIFTPAALYFYLAWFVGQAVSA